jgi:hypothetical protein
MPWQPGRPIFGSNIEMDARILVGRRPAREEEKRRLQSLSPQLTWCLRQDGALPPVAPWVPLSLGQCG